MNESDEGGLVERFWDMAITYSYILIKVHLCHLSDGKNTALFSCHRRFEVLVVFSSYVIQGRPSTYTPHRIITPGQGTGTWWYRIAEACAQRLFIGKSFSRGVLELQSQLQS